MSAHATGKRVTTTQIRARKGGEPIVMLTAYSALTARLVDPHCDMILVGDSLAMVEHGMDSTLGATLDLMIAHGKSVMRGADRALVVVDLPFGSYEASPQQAFASAARVLSETGCTAVKLEGGAGMAETIAFLTARGVPVVAHVGLTPQATNTLGGFKTQGRERAGWAAIEADAAAVARAGAFAVVLEGIVEPVARAIAGSPRVSAATIGIGASAGAWMVSDFSAPLLYTVAGAAIGLSSLLVATIPERIPVTQKSQEESYATN